MASLGMHCMTGTCLYNETGPDPPRPPPPIPHEHHNKKVGHLVWPDSHWHLVGTGACVTDHKLTCTELNVCIQQQLVVRANDNC